MDESNRMIKDSESRFGKAVEDLKDLIVRSALQIICSHH